jgi:hypothetical protein
VSKDIAKAADNNLKEAKTTAQRKYIINHTEVFKQKLRESPMVTFVPSPVYAQYFGKIYTYLINCIGFTVRFDGTPQKFPKIIKDALEKKIMKVAESNMPVVSNIKVREE